MRQEEFLNCFQNALEGKVSDSIIQENVNYYRNYINEQIRMGRTEDEVLQALGDPRLRAKTIEESSNFAKEENEQTSYFSGNYNRGTWSGSHSGTYRQEADYTQGEDTRQQKVHQIPGWLIAIAMVIVLALSLTVVFSVISAIAPFILTVAAVALVVSIIKNWIRRY